MANRIRSFIVSRRAAVAAVLFGAIGLTAVCGTFLLAAQERSRMRIMAEYRAFQLVTDLLRAYDTDNANAISAVDGLRAFGVYSRRGDLLFRFGSAPENVFLSEAALGAKFDGGVVSFIRMVGGNPQDGQRGRRGAGQPMMGVLPPSPMGNPGGEHQMMGGPGMGMGARLVYIAYDATALRSGERAVFIVAFIVILSIAAAFLLLYSLVRSLDEYRQRETRNRELLALGEAARTLAHEIKNPLGVVKIQCALLRKVTGEEAKNGLRVIEEETDRLALLASRVKAFLAADAGTPREVSAAACADSFAARYVGSLNAVSAPSAAGSHVSIDPLRLDQILDNLISNAIESMDGRPFVPVELSISAGGGKVRFAVADRGSGIAQENSSRVYDLFFTTKTAGAGIGLALAMRYAQSAGGALSHAARPDGGTVFTLELPELKRGTR